MSKRIQLRPQEPASDDFFRDRALELNRSLYGWKHLSGLPAFCDGLPALEVEGRLDAIRASYDITTSITAAAIKTIGWTLHNTRKNKLTHYDRFSTARRAPKVASRWRDDEEFAQQRLNGVNPLLIERCSAIPPNFAVTDERVRSVIGDHTLESLRDAGRLYLCDWKELHGVPVNLGRFLTAPMVLFWVDDRKVLMPLAIQLDQNEEHRSGEGAPAVFTPDDEPWLWLAARTHVQTADAAYHEILTHLFRTHLVMETFWVAVRRALPPQHPVHELLRPFFAGTIDVNYHARTTMIAPGGPIDLAISVGTDGAYWLINQATEDFSFADLHPVQHMERRGIPDLERPYLTGPHRADDCTCEHLPVCKGPDDPECNCTHTARCLASDDELPGYHYRDDVLLLWDAIGTFARTVLRLYYRSDADVAGDEELADWCRELTAHDGGRIRRGLPLNGERLTTREDLEHVVQQIMFTTSCEHSAVNNGQYDYFGYIPNAPGALYLPPPTAVDDRWNEAEFCYMLPPMKSVDTQMTLVHLLSRPARSRLGDFPDDFFQSVDPVHKAIDRLRDDLDQIALHIQERNKQLTVPYTYLDPVQIATSINV